MRKKKPFPENPFADKVRDYRLLTERWLRLVRSIPSLEMYLFCEAGGYPIFVIRSVGRDPDKPSVYLSAGIHGDEPAPVEALIRWASEELPGLGDWNWQIFPCLNPWGLERNNRLDAEGRDLNRCYNSRKVPQIAAQIAVMRGHAHDVAVCLHEDYDARGFYLYEIASARPHWGESLCGGIQNMMPPDSRRTIDGHVAKKGVIRRRITPTLMRGHPEAFVLHFRHSLRTFTLETPSEESLGRRVLLHWHFLGSLIGKIKKSRRETSAKRTSIPGYP